MNGIGWAVKEMQADLLATDWEIVTERTPATGRVDLEVR